MRPALRPSGPRQRSRPCGLAALGVCALAFFVALAPSAAAQTLPSRGAHPQVSVPERAQLERRFASVDYLIEKSSAAKQIDAGSNTEARAQRAQAQALYREAQQALQREDLEAAARLLGEASAQMRDAARAASQVQMNGNKKRAAFANRMASVKALLAADLRIVQEKHASTEAAQASAAVEAAMADASRLADAGRLDDANTAIDRAYLMARAAVTGLRRGDTLTRSAHFANAQEEYAYELERNDTHIALLRSLLADAGDAPANADMAKRAMQEARKLHDAGEALAAQGDHAAAVKQLEESTGTLLRALRGLGIRVPG